MSIANQFAYAASGAGIGGIAGASGINGKDKNKDKARKIIGGAVLGAMGGGFFARHKQNKFQDFFRKAEERRQYQKMYEEEYKKAYGFYDGRKGSSGFYGGAAGGARKASSKYDKAKQSFAKEFSGLSDAERKRKFRQYASENHPDRGGDEEVFKGLNAAYEMFKRK